MTQVCKSEPAMTHRSMEEELLRKDLQSLPVSVTMIVKDEERFIRGAIESAMNVMGVTDIVVVDTGSKDRTREIAIECGARVFEFKWIDDFSAARNYANEQALNDWIFFLDADEEIAEANMAETLNIMDKIDCIGTAMMDEMLDNSRHPATRLFNRKAHYFTRKIHENLRPFDGYTSRERQIPILMKHFGYTQEVWQEKGKYERNMRMLQKELKRNPNDAYCLYQLGKCNFAYDRNLDKACEYFEQALLKCEDTSVGYFYATVECYGYALINTGRYQEAMNLLEVYYEQFSDNPNFRFLAGHILQNNGLFVEAVEAYRSCIGADMTDTKGVTSFLSFFNIGVILECLELFEDAIEMYKSCGDYEPAKARLRKLKM